jgi:hypothetical protein
VTTVPDTWPGPRRARRARSAGGGAGARRGPTAARQPSRPPPSRPPPSRPLGPTTHPPGAVPIVRPVGAMSPPLGGPVRRPVGRGLRVMRPTAVPMAPTRVGLMERPVGRGLRVMRRKAVAPGRRAMALAQVGPVERRVGRGVLTTAPRPVRSGRPVGVMALALVEPVKRPGGRRLPGPHPPISARTATRAATAGARAGPRRREGPPPVAMADRVTSVRLPAGERSAAVPAAVLPGLGEQQRRAGSARAVRRPRTAVPTATITAATITTTGDRPATGERAPTAAAPLPGSSRPRWRR